MNEHAPAATILVVDDHDSFRASAGRLLKSLGFDVVGEAADGESALLEVERLRPRLVLLDVQLPDIDGFAVTERIRARYDDGAGENVRERGDTDPAGRYSPVIVLTSSRDRADYGTLVDECGCAGFISKDDLAKGTIVELLG